jgi:uncharacterized protein (DUF1810 family)
MDAVMFRSGMMTLFVAVATEQREFRAALTKYFAGAASRNLACREEQKAD